MYRKKLISFLLVFILASCSKNDFTKEGNLVKKFVLTITDKEIEDNIRFKTLTTIFPNCEKTIGYSIILFDSVFIENSFRKNNKVVIQTKNFSTDKSSIKSLTFYLQNSENDELEIIDSKNMIDFRKHNDLKQKALNEGLIGPNDLLTDLEMINILNLAKVLTISENKDTLTVNIHFNNN